MKIFTDKKSIFDFLQSKKRHKKVIGFVPTMGALHKGHLSLVKEARKQSDVVVVSIFVNPTQFNDTNDLKNYPRTTDQDIELLKNENCDVVFLPSVAEMYPEKDTRIFDFGAMETVMEGKYRKGHFNGVAQIVSKLFDVIIPDKVFLGEKDFQQLAIIKQLVKQENYPIEIIACATMREDDGLAMSSRNARLKLAERKNAALISKTLFLAREMSRQLTVNELKQWVVKSINQNEYLDVEYFEIVNNTTLQSIERWSDADKKTACIAAFCGDVRLIDNVKI